MKRKPLKQYVEELRCEELEGNKTQAWNCETCIAKGFLEGPGLMAFDEWHVGDLLKEASARVAPNYFEITLMGGDTHYRERAYCYELYHQMRCLWPAFGAEVVEVIGELDKAGHYMFRNRQIRGAKPDFLFHMQGTMEFNHTVIEVKRGEFSSRSWCDDLETLDAFLRLAGYRRAVFLVVGKVPGKKKGLVDVLKDELSEFAVKQHCTWCEHWAKHKIDVNAKENRSRLHEFYQPVAKWAAEVEIWHHEEQGDAAKKIAFLGDLKLK